MMVIVYGIPNCDTVKKARKWLDAHSVSYQFHDFSKDGVDKQLLQDFLKQLEIDVLINKRGMSWRKLDDKQRNISSQQQAIDLMLAMPTLIKRPVLAVNDTYHVGFSEAAYKAINFG